MTDSDIIQDSKVDAVTIGSSGVTYHDNNAQSGFIAGDTTGVERREAALNDAIVQGSKQHPDSFRAKMYDLQAKVASLPEIDFPLQHLYVPGAYARTIFLPKGSIIIGKIHKHSHFNILSQGEVEVVTENGGIEHIVGPKVMVSPAGTKRAVYAMADTTWTTIHLTDETDLSKIEGEVISSTYEEYEQFLSVEKIRADYLRVLAETGKSHEWVRATSENIDDQVPMPAGFEHLVIIESSIEGMGLFTEKDIKAGETIGLSRINGKRTPLGRYANHSPFPNTEFKVLANGDLHSVALQDIAAGFEILNDYRQGARIWGAKFDENEVEKTKRMML